MASAHFVVETACENFHDWAVHRRPTRSGEYGRVFRAATRSAIIFRLVREGLDEESLAIFDLLKTQELLMVNFTAIK